MTQPVWKIESVLQLLLGVFGGIAFAGFLAAGLGYQSAPGQIDYVMMLVGALSFHGVGILWLNWFVRDHQMSWPQALGLRDQSAVNSVLPGLLTGVVGFFLCISVGDVSAWLLRQFTVEPELQTTIQALQSTTSRGWIIVFGCIPIVLAPVVEEFLFRGILYPLVVQLGFPRLAFYGSSVLFSASHANLNAFLPLLALAMVLVWLYRRAGLLACIVAHATFNAINFTLTLQHGALSAANP